MNTVDSIDIIISKLDEIIFQHIEITHNIIFSLYTKNSIEYAPICEKRDYIESIFKSIPDISFFSYKSIKNIQIINNLIFDLIQDRNSNTYKSLTYFENLQKQILSTISSVKINLIEIKNHHDYLTKLPSRKLLFDKINYNKEKNKEFYICFIDIDHFKDINDKFGYDVGDDVLIEVSNLVNIDSFDVYRYGGEEFILLMYKKLKKEIENNVLILHNELKHRVIKSLPESKNVTFSSGTTQFDTNKSINDNIKKASLLMREAKHSGRNQAKFDF